MSSETKIVTFNDLPHVVRELGETCILVLNTGAVINPEATAMLQALYSRSVGGVRLQLRKVGRRGSREFLDQYYLGYGDRSIGDCGTTTVFVDGVSMLVAKAFQDSPLYCGQESSTRYIDFSRQRFVDPIGTDESHAYLERWRQFYVEAQEPTRAHLRSLFPRPSDADETEYEKTIKARTFDITRGFLPTGATTNFTWHGELRVMADHLRVLRRHPVPEVRAVAHAMTNALQEAHPDSFRQKVYEAEEAYIQMYMEGDYYFESPREFEGVELISDTMKLDRYAQARILLAERPLKAELPKFMRAWGDMEFGFPLDFGSFRDAQRNRAVIQRMPLVTARHGFEKWYLESLPDSLRKEARDLLYQQQLRMSALTASADTSKEEVQYYIPMGYNLPNLLAGDLPALVWFVELRGTRHIHPTLRVKTQRMAEIMLERMKHVGLVLHMDNEPDKFDVRRGRHDIVERT